MSFSVSYPQLIQTWTEGIASNKPFNISSQYFSYSDEQNHEDAVGLMKYAFEEVLGWTPYDVQNHCTKEVIDMLGLRSAYKALLWPYTYNLEGEKKELIEDRSGYGYVAALLYPDVIFTLGKKNLWIIEYNKMMSETRETKGFRIDDFLGNDGYDHARLLLNHYLVNNPDERFENMEKVYDLFANEKESDALLKKAKLYVVGHTLFHSGLDYLHASLPDDGTDAGRDHFYYDFLCFEKSLEHNNIIESKKKEILNALRNEGKTVHTISKELNLDKDVLYLKIQEWNENRAEHFKDKLIELYRKKVPMHVISEKSKIPVDVLEKKFDEWNVVQKVIRIGDDD